MRLALLPLVLIAALIGAGPAGAQGPIRAEGGWLSWWDEVREDRVLERGGRAYPFPAVRGPDLGTDARGRAVATYTDCTSEPYPQFTDCGVLERRLFSGATRTLVPRRDGFGLEAVAQHRGTLAVAQNRGRAGRGSRVLLRRPGRSRFTVVTPKTRAVRVDLEDGLLSYFQWSSENYVRTVDLRRSRPRTRTWVTDDTRDFDCKCEQKLEQVGDATLEGRYVYWLEYTARSTDGSSIGGGSHAVLFSARFVRVDALAARPAVAEYRILDEDPSGARIPSSFAVDRGRIYHDQLRDLRRGVRPKWRRTGERLPIRHQSSP
ncbi:MAG: hypothetical protein M3340_13980 [Actinomycetota bacterium]|nr:hypothetical protein [Actinomycetota bacterium]